MNAKEAREIIGAFERESRNVNYAPSTYTQKTVAEAKGFLEAVEKFKPVVEAAEKVVDHFAFIFKGMHMKSPGQILIEERLAEAIESYRRDVLGEE